MPTRPTLTRIYRLKLLALVAILVALGLLAALIADWLSTTKANRLLTSLVQTLSDALILTGALGLAVDFFTGRDREAKDDDRIRRLLKESAPEFRDAVLEGFALQPDDLKRVATPELLDHLAENALALRFGDATFAREVYADLRTQAITAAERWTDVQVSVRLSPAGERDAVGIPRFDVYVAWEYTTVPSHPVRRFACVSDRDEYYELTSDSPATSTWFMTPRPGMNASDRAAFELLEFSVDGEPRPIRRTERKTGQTYSVDLGRQAGDEPKPVRIRHLYRTVTPQSGHFLFFEVPQPARGVSFELDYSPTDISFMTVTQLISSVNRPYVSRFPETAAAKVISIETTGWLLPRSGVAFVWTLSSEEAEATAARAA
jgi:hypothetical protein